MKKKDIALLTGGAIGAAIAIKLLTRPSTVKWSDVGQLVANSDRSDFIEIDGIRIHFQEFGEESAATIIMIHGYAASTHAWSICAPRLAEEGYRVITIDLVGFGFSEKPKWFEYTIDAQARMVERFMDRLGIGRATVIGSSYGGAVAATLALDYPERVEKLGLVAAVINDDQLEHPLMQLATMPAIAEIVTPFLLDSRSYITAKLKTIFAPANHDMITPERISAFHRPLRAADAHHSVVATSRGWSANRIEKDLGLIKQPTLIVWGDQDQIVPLANGAKLYQEILNSRFFVFKDCGHLPQEERAGLFVELVSEFCGNEKGKVTNETDRFEPDTYV
jgi:pimeloyl-ACP methyl ester carboxylesterase